MKLRMCFIWFYLTSDRSLSFINLQFKSMFYIIWSFLLSFKTKSHFSLWKDQKGMPFFSSFPFLYTFNFWPEKKKKSKHTHPSKQLQISLIFFVLKYLSRGSLASHSQVCAVFLWKGKTHQKVGISLSMERGGLIYIQSQKDTLDVYNRVLATLHVYPCVLPSGGNTGMCPVSTVPCISSAWWIHPLTIQTSIIKGISLCGIH